MGPSAVYIPRLGHQLYVHQDGTIRCIYTKTGPSAVYLYKNKLTLAIYTNIARWDYQLYEYKG